MPIIWAHGVHLYICPLSLDKFLVYVASISSNFIDIGIKFGRTISYLPKKLFNSSDYVSECQRPSTGFATLDYAAMLDITWYESQLGMIGRGKKANPKLSAWRSVFQSFGRTGAYAFKPRRTRSAKRH